MESMPQWPEISFIGNQKFDYDFKSYNLVSTASNNASTSSGTTPIAYRRGYFLYTPHLLY
jgi:hypothetical protein